MFNCHKKFIGSLVCCFALMLFTINVSMAQQIYSISGTVTLQNASGSEMEEIHIFLEPQKKSIHVSTDGTYKIDSLSSGHYTVSVFGAGYEKQTKKIHIEQQNITHNFELKADHKILDEVIVNDKKEDIFNIATLNAIEGTAIYEGKKTELIVMDKMAANTATNNARQIFAKIPGLVVWESDCGGLQLGIATRGLSPNRTANFNTRQNGYDISADAIGYPESYYMPSMEAIERVEVVRGAASLQYGTQFGGMVNFVFRKGPKDKPWELTSRQTAGAYGLFNSYNSIGGQTGKLNYFGYLNYRQGNCPRPNSQFNLINSFGGVTYQITEKLSATVEFTHMNYLAKQAGGLTDAQFNQDPFQSNRSRNWFKVAWNMPAVTFDYKISDRTKINVRTFGLLSNRQSLGDQTPIYAVEKLNTNRTLITDYYKNIGTEARLLHHYNIGSMKSSVLLGGRFYSGQTIRKQGTGNSLSTGSDADFTYLHPDSLEAFSYVFNNKNMAFFCENIFNISPRFTVTPGARYEYINTAASGYIANTTTDFNGNIIGYTQKPDSRSVSRSFVLLGLGTSFKVNETNELYANISQNYRAVTFGDIAVSNPNASVDANLHDEKGYNADLGIKGTHKKVFYYDVSVFYMAYKDRIGDVIKQLPPFGFESSYRANIADSKSYGLESIVEWQFWKTLKPSAKNNLSAFVNFSLTDARYVNTDNLAVRNKRVEYVAPLILRGGFNYQSNNFTATLQGSYVAQQFTDATNTTQPTLNAVNGLIPSYYVFDFSVKYQYKWLLTAAGINNITNNYYFTRRANSYPGPGIVPADPRTFFVSLGIKVSGKKKN